MSHPGVPVWVFFLIGTEGCNESFTLGLCEGRAQEAAAPPLPTHPHGLNTCCSLSVLWALRQATSPLCATVCFLICAIPTSLAVEGRKRTASQGVTPGAGLHTRGRLVC